MFDNLQHFCHLIYVLHQATDQPVSHFRLCQSYPIFVSEDILPSEPPPASFYLPDSGGPSASYLPEPPGQAVSLHAFYQIEPSFTTAPQNRHESQEAEFNFKRLSTEAQTTSLAQEAPTTGYLTNPIYLAPLPSASPSKPVYLPSGLVEVKEKEPILKAPQLLELEETILSNQPESVIAPAECVSQAAAARAEQLKSQQIEEELNSKQAKVLELQEAQVLESKGAEVLKLQEEELKSQHAEILKLREAEVLKERETQLELLAQARKAQEELNARVEAERKAKEKEIEAEEIERRLKLRDEEIKKELKLKEAQDAENLRQEQEKIAAIKAQEVKQKELKELENKQKEQEKAARLQETIIKEEMRKKKELRLEKQDEFRVTKGENHAVDIEENTCDSCVSNVSVVDILAEKLRYESFRFYIISKNNIINGI